MRTKAMTRAMSFVIVSGLVGACSYPLKRGTAPLNGPETGISVSMQSFQQRALCTARNGEFVDRDSVEVLSGDSLIQERLLQEWYSDPASPFALNREWFRNDEPIRFAGRDFYKNSPPVKFTPDQLISIGHHHETPLFVEKGAGITDPSIIFVLVDATCSFQGYYYFN